MAELRTIQKSEIRDFTAIRYLLALSDQYAVIPYPLRSLGLQNPEQDLYVLVIGPTGLFLLAYHLIYSHQFQQHYLTLAYDIERSADMLDHYLLRYLSILPPIQQAIVVPNGNIQGQATDRVAFVSWGKLRTWITEGPVQLDNAVIRRILQILKAEPLYHRVFRYQILAEVDRAPGQLSYLAMDTVEDRPVILKEVFLPLGISHEESHALIRGAKLARELQHENIVRVENIIPREDRVYIVSEWCEGAITLRQYLDEHPGSIPLTTAIQLIKDLCQALMAAHAKGIIHRNLTPDNLLVTPEHRLKVFNFDAAKKEGMHTLQSTALKKLAEENPYADPDYAIGTHQVDQRVDVYSVGVIFYELLTGNKPTHYDELLWEPPSKLIPGLPTYMDRLIARAIKFDKDQRYSTIHAFYSALEKGATHLIGSRYELMDNQVHKAPNSLIFKAKDMQTGQMVALKKLLIPPTTDYQTRLQTLQMTLEPMKELKFLQHNALVKVIDTLIEDDDGYVVMEWIEGHNLREHLNALPHHQGLLPEAVRHIVLQLSDVLNYIHQEGYVHGDIKPENVMISQDWKVTLLDFVPWSKQEMGTLQKIPKTTRYMAPELLDGSHVPDEQTDLFSLGVLMYELLTHRFPYDYAQLRSCKDREASPKPQALDETVPEDLAAVVYRALAFSRDERYHSFELFQADLENKCDIAEPATRSESVFSRYHVSKEDEIPSLVWILTGLSLFLLAVYLFQQVQQWPGVHQLPVLEELYYE